MSVQEEVAAKAATMYRADLKRYSERADRDRRLDDVLKGLIVSLDRAVEKRCALTPSDVPFRHETLTALPLAAEPELALPLVNEYGIGLGNSGGRAVAMGTEAAYD